MYDAEMLNQAMENQQLTNEKLAVRADLSASTVSSIRNGEENVRLLSLKKAANALNLQVEIHFVPKSEIATAGA